ncbi:MULTISPECIES: nitrous oxide reductase accessory protein NosL [Lysinibacillus]|uniref:nitrous oxide reductase accessory protein NosL n=1 Tax=Lysinibacillus TaxID=400634 RepID=UPI00083C9C87|nr:MULTISPECIES: nitrous oxide reductase accessory protein NosL [Lysinibacillus]
MKKLWLPVLAVLLLLAACGTEKEKVKEEESKQDVAATEAEAKDKSEKETSVADSRLQEPKEDTMCEMCNMKVYMKDEEMGEFSTQAIKEDGTIAFYDDIGCLVNAEVANNEKNEKFVRDFNTKDWVKVDDATIVKTDLKSPMNWGYVYFNDKADADKYIADNPTAHVEELQKIKDDALERRNKKMKEKAEKEAKGESDSMHMEEKNHDGQGH